MTDTELRSEIERLEYEKPRIAQWTDYDEARLSAYREVEAFRAAMQIVKDCCDRDWEDENPYQIAIIASNAMFWRNEQIRKLRDEIHRLRTPAPDRAAGSGEGGTE